MIIVKEVYNFLKKCGTFYVATLDGKQPRIRPFGAVDIYDNKLHIQTANTKKVFRQLQANPQIGICCFDGSTWLRIEATAVLNDNLDAREHMLIANPVLQKIYAANDGVGVVFYLKDAIATFSSFTDEPKIVTF